MCGGVRSAALRRCPKPRAVGMQRTAAGDGVRAAGIASVRLSSYILRAASNRISSTRGGDEVPRRRGRSQGEEATGGVTNLKKRERDRGRNLLTINKRLKVGKRNALSVIIRRVCNWWQSSMQILSHVEEHLERVCCLLVLNSVTSTLQWIRQPEPRDMHDVCVFVCKCVYFFWLCSP
jgi:hypothetical protein